MIEKPPHRNACTWVEPMVTLRDGRVVGSCSEEWKWQCLAQTVLNMPSRHDRKVFLEKWGAKHGEDTRLALQNEIMALWSAGRG